MISSSQCWRQSTCKYRRILAIQYALLHTYCSRPREVEAKNSKFLPSREWLTCKEQTSSDTEIVAHYQYCNQCLERERERDRCCEKVDSKVVYQTNTITHLFAISYYTWIAVLYSDSRHPFYYIHKPI